MGRAKDKGNKKKKSNTGTSVRRSFPETVMSLAMVLILAGMQLVYHDYYFDILITKYHYYCVCAGGAVLLCAGYAALCGRWENVLKGRKLSELFDWLDVMVMAFVLTAIVSAALSPFGLKAVWGDEGRHTGAFLLALYGAYYVCSAACYRQREWHIEVFLATGMIMCLLGLADSFDLDLLGFKREIAEGQRYIFTSTIGNINTYTACVAMVMAVAGVLFASCENSKINIWHGVCVVVAYAALIVGESDNAYLSLAMFFGALPLYLFRKKAGVRKYVWLLAMFFTVAYGIGIVQRVFEGIVVPITGLFNLIVGFSRLPLIVALLWMLVLSLYGWERWREIFENRRKTAAEDQEAVVRQAELSGEGGKKAAEQAEPSKEERKEAAGRTESFGKKATGRTENSGVSPRILIRIWWGVIAAAVCMAVWALWDVNVLGNVQRYGGLGEYLLFNDGWGTDRGFVWRIAVENYLKFPVLQKLFGCGPDTFSILTSANNYEEMVSGYHVLYDSVHNEYLQYLVTMGCLGLISYLGVMAAAVRNVVRKKLDNPAAVACMFAVLCYGAQAAVNINQPIAAPIMWTLLCVMTARKTDSVNFQNK